MIRRKKEGKNASANREKWVQTHKVNQRELAVSLRLINLGLKLL